MTGARGGWRLEVPPAYAAGVAAHGGEAGRRWLATLPELVAELLDTWGLTPESPVRHGFLGLVVPARRGDEPVVLKVSRPSPEVDNQAAALAAWAGRGMVLLLAADLARGALLLERLDPGRTLADVDPDLAYVTAADLARRLAVPAADGALPTLAEHVADWPRRWAREASTLENPLPEPLLDAAVTALRAGAADPRDPVLVDHDLHLRNIAAGRREAWLAVDPRGLVGDAGYALAPLLWNDFRGVDDLQRRFATLVDGTGFDRGRTAAWTLVRVVDHFLWSTAAGLTWDPAACRAVADWLLTSGLLP